MKKTLILLVSVLLIISILYLWQQKAFILLHQAAGVITESTTPETIKDNSIQLPVQIDDTADEEIISHNTDQNDSESLIFRGCVDLVNEKYPGMDLEFYKVVSELYRDGEMAAGISPYQTMPTTSLKSLARANDVGALLVLGSETIWLATTGVMISQHSDVPKFTRKEKKEIVKSHKVNFKLLEEGEDYLFRAAVLGKVGALGEYASLSSMAAKRLKENNVDEQKVQEFIAKILAYSALTLEVHRKDGLLLKIMGSQLSSIENRIFKEFNDHEDFETFKANIQDRAGQKFEDIFQRWKESRNYHGFPVYPKVLTGELIEYGNEMEACYKAVNN